MNNNLSERLQGTIRQREKVMRGLKSLRSAQLVMDGWALHYNYFRPHESLGDRTPAQAARIDRPFKNWEDVARLDVRPYSQIRVKHEKRDRRFDEKPRKLMVGDRTPREKRLTDKRLKRMF